MDPQKTEIPNSEAEKEEFLRSLDALVLGGKDVGVAADFDQNISKIGASGGMDPRDVQVDPGARQSLIAIRDSGRDVVIISSRGARDIARIVDIPGVAIVGSQGWETFIADANNPTEGKSLIHRQFDPFSTQITGILGEVRSHLSHELGLPSEVGEEPNLELPTTDGKIILQRKGYNDQYPEGISLTWNLNQIAPEKRQKYIDLLKKYYEEAFDKYSNLPGVDKEKLASLCGEDILSENDGKLLSFQIKPTYQASKSKALIQLMREPGDPKRPENFRHMPYHPYWIYSGDNAQQDVPVMRAGHSASAFSLQKRGLLGVWSKPDSEEYTQPRGVDVTVSGVAGNAAILGEIAQVFQRYPLG